MNYSEVKELIELINNSDLSYFEMQDGKEYIKMDKSISRNYTSASNEVIDSRSLSKLAITDIDDNLQLESPNTHLLTLDGNLNNINKDKDKNSNEDDIEFIKSPIVGTFYESVSPDSEPFVSVGQKVSKGEVVCIIEAMKLMNEISAEFDCEIIGISGENGKMVQYGDPLFKIRRI